MLSFKETDRLEMNKLHLINLAPFKMGKLSQARIEAKFRDGRVASPWVHEFAANMSSNFRLNDGEGIDAVLDGNRPIENRNIPSTNKCSLTKSKHAGVGRNYDREEHLAFLDANEAILVSHPLNTCLTHLLVFIPSQVIKETWKLKKELSTKHLFSVLGLRAHSHQKCVDRFVALIDKSFLQEDKLYSCDFDFKW